MTTISLHKYHNQINDLLEDSQFSLAANHCRYILQQHPRHVDTYRLLARTLIEQGDYSGATELFQRVLSADPNDYIAHAGLSVVYREEDVLSQAVWHLERAFEIEPYNGAIQQELKNLYIDFSEQKSRKQREESIIEIPDSLPLTKGALARLYIRGEFYAQAIDILQETLAEDEDRIDLEVLLAEALWRDHQRKAAVQVCLQVLEKLPNCITANAVLAEIWLEIGRVEEAQNYLKELQALTLTDFSSQDVESPVGSAFKPEGAIALPVVFEVERMGDDMVSLSDMEALGTVTNDSEMPVEDDTYQWLEGMGDELVVDTGDVLAEEPVSMMTDSDWLRRELAAEKETAVSEEINNWLDESAELDAVEDDSDFDALGIMTAGAVAAGVIGNQLTDDDEEAVADDDSLAWLAEESFIENIPEEDETIFDQLEQTEEAQEMPDWLSDMSGEELEPVQVDRSEAIIHIEDDESEPDYFSETEEDDDLENIYGWLEDAASDEVVEELTPGELDLSQFAEFDRNEDETDEEDEEIVWRLTDELNPLGESEVEEEEDDEVDEADEFDFEISPDDTGDLEEVPDWLMGSSGTDELEAASLTEKAGNEIAEELAEWVAANQPEADEEDMPDWLSGESEVPKTAALGAAVAGAMETDEEADDFFSDELPDWMVDSSFEIDDSAPLDSAPLTPEETVEADSGPLEQADLPDWLMGSTIDADDSGFLQTDDLLMESEASPEDAEDLPDWLAEGTAGYSDEEDAQPQETKDENLPDWLSSEVELDEDEDDGRSTTAVVGGLLGAAAAGAFAKELFNDDDNDVDEENEVMEDAVSDKQDNLIGPQDEPEESETASQETLDEFDWLDDLDKASTNVEKEPLSTGELDDGLAWMDLNDTDDSGELNLDALLGLETEETTVETSSEEKETPSISGLAEDESLDWLDALADEDPQAVDEMPTWQWSEDNDDESILALDETTDIPDLLETAEPDDLGSDIEDLETIFAEEPADAEVAEDLDDAMSWLEDLAAEPDAPVEELPSVAEDMDLDNFFTADSTDAFVDDLSDESQQTETLDEIFAADTQNDSWLEGLAMADEEPLPDFLEEDMELNVDGSLAEEIAEETAVSELESALEQTGDIGEPPEDVDDAMAWLEQLAARQGAPLDELPSVDAEPEPEEDGLDAVEIAAVAAAGVTALGAVNALSDDDGEEDRAESISEIPEVVADVSDLDTTVTEDELMAMEVPEDPDEAMAWLEKLAARQGAPLDELPSVSEDDAIFAETETFAEEDLFDFDDHSLPPLSETDDNLDDLDETMAWLDGLEDEEQPEEIEEEPEPVDFAESAVVAVDDLSDELDWLESVTGSDAETVSYNPDELSVSDDDLADALDKLALLMVAGTVVGTTSADEDEREVDELEAETAVIEIDPAAEIVEDNIIEEMPEDPDEAMAWLEKLAARQGAPLDELPSVPEDEYDDLAAGAGIVTAAENEDILEETELAADTPLDELSTAEDQIETVSPEDMDMDDAMAWLERLAARQGTSLDELPTVKGAPEIDDDLDTPEWIAKQTGPLDPDVLDSLDIPEVSDETLGATSDEDFFAALNEVPAIEGIETGIKDSGDTLTSDLEDIDDSMPDWLSGEEEDVDEAAIGHTGWLNTLDEPDMGDWLAAEAEATSSSDILSDAMPEAVDLGTRGLDDTGSLQDNQSRRGTGELRLPQEPTAPSMLTTELDEEQIFADLDLDGFGAGLDQAQLEAARSSLAGGDIDAALHDYQGLVEAGESMHTVISDLERASELHQDKPMVRRMLGDAYMRNGQINKAIETYRNALDQL